MHCSKDVQITHAQGTISSIPAMRGTEHVSSHLCPCPAHDIDITVSLAVQQVLICGWREEAFMSDMLREMDHGPSALPAGSQLTLFNSSANAETMARVKTRNR